jgi:flagellar basal-body rod protein FlgB
VLASNLANADTPNYKAQDLDFKTALRLADPGGTPDTGVRLVRTHAAHADGDTGSVVDQTLLYRTASQPSLDGNTVDANIEKSEFTQNALGYLVSLRFVSGRIQGLLTAIKGE